MILWWFVVEISTSSHFPFSACGVGFFLFYIYFVLSFCFIQSKVVLLLLFLSFFNSSFSPFVWIMCINVLFVVLSFGVLRYSPLQIWSWVKDWWNVHIQTLMHRYTIHIHMLMVTLNLLHIENYVNAIFSCINFLPNHFSYLSLIFSFSNRAGKSHNKTTIVENFLNREWNYSPFSISQTANMHFVQRISTLAS